MPEKTIDEGYPVGRAHPSCSETDLVYPNIKLTKKPYLEEKEEKSCQNLTICQ